MSAEATPPSAIFHRSLGKVYPTAVSGQGIYLETKDGKQVIDGSSGAAVSCLGHGHPAVIQAIVEQAQRMSFAHTSFFTSNPAEELAELLLSQSAGAFHNVMFLSSGSEAVESAIKLARQYHVSNRQPERINFISRRYSYHGNTLGCLSAGFNPPRREQFAPLLSQAFHHVSPCFFSRDASPGEAESAYVDRLLQEYEQKIQSLGPKTIAGLIVEPIGGATLGSVPSAEGYLTGLRRLCDKYGSLLLFDEVMCGMGRAGTLHAWQSLGNVAPDLQTIGKGLGAGYQPISAILVGRQVHDSIKASQDVLPFVSGHTYQGHSIGCAAALAVQKVIIEQGLLANVEAMGKCLRSQLEASTPHLKEVRGLGLFLTAEFKAIGGSPISSRVAARCLDNGAAVYLCSSAVDAVMFAPPFIITEEEVGKLVEIFVLSVNEVLLEGVSAT
ncbi:unnamed protein product [Clonostachys solani]|uniref:Aminotransferase n=1 Tax=Clonostachys solani TaxID=160281 RepID=A0A9N9ZHC8_9HYPO|nr:unnamed protein product [Clonostachys solani]